MPRYKKEPKAYLQRQMACSDQNDTTILVSEPHTKDTDVPSNGAIRAGCYRLPHSMLKFTEGKNFC